MRCSHYVCSVKMSEEMSSSSASSSSSSSSSAQMKRQNVNLNAGAAVAKEPLDSEEMKENLENSCKRRRKSGHNNNDVAMTPPDTDCSISAAENGADALSMVGENQTSSPIANATGSSGNEKAVPSVNMNDMQKINDLETCSPVFVLETPESSSLVDSSADAPVIETSTVNAASGTRPVDLRDEIVVIEDSDSVGSTPNTVNAITQRQCRIRQRSYRRSAPEMSSASVSPTHEEANNDSNNTPDNLSNISDDSEDLDDAPFIFHYDTQSSESHDDINSGASRDPFDPSSESDILISDEELEFDDADENNGRAGEDANGRNHKNSVFEIVDKVLAKNLSTCTWNTTKEVMWREYGISSRYGGRTISHSVFNARFYASQFVVERMKLSHCLRRHSGCVNSLNFNRSGDLLCSGSDDKRIVVWDWARNKFKYTFKSGHKENIFQTKFISSGTALDIVSAGRDGQVRRALIPSSGKATTSFLYKHRNAVHKLVICPHSPYEILSVGEDGYIRHCDLRSSASSLSLLKVTNSVDPCNRVRLFSIAHHPYSPEVCVCGSDEYVRVYDKRKFDETVYKMCPSHLANMSVSQVTCCSYNHNGSEILATYSDEQIYLFGNYNYTPGSFLHTYRGHYNHRTIKGVNFFGPNSEYVISGSDCGNIFFWDKNTEAIINFMSADTVGVVNCLEPHPSIPVLATSGLEYNVKVWAPGSESTVPDKEKVKACITRNIYRSGLQGRMDLLDSALNDIILEAFHPDVFDTDDSLSGSSLAHYDMENVSSSSSSSDSTNGTPSTENNDHQYYAHDSDDSSEADNDPLNRLSCHTQ